jgi:hypothetical protein
MSGWGDILDFVSFGWEGILGEGLLVIAGLLDKCGRWRCLDRLPPKVASVAGRKVLFAFSRIYN